MLRQPFLLSLDIDNTTLKMPPDQQNPVPYLNGELLLKLIECTVLSGGKVILNTNRSPALDADGVSNGGFTCEQLKNDIERRLNIAGQNKITVCLRTPEAQAALIAHNAEPANVDAQIPSTKAFAIYTALNNDRTDEEDELVFAIHVDDEQPVVTHLNEWNNPRLTVIKVPNPEDAHGSIEYLQQLSQMLGIDEVLLNYQLSNERKKIHLRHVDELRAQAVDLERELTTLLENFQAKLDSQRHLRELRSQGREVNPEELNSLNKEIEFINEQAESINESTHELAKNILGLAEKIRIPPDNEFCSRLSLLLKTEPSAEKTFSRLLQEKLTAITALTGAIREHVNSPAVQATQLEITPEQFGCLRDIHGFLLTYHRGETPADITPEIAPRPAAMAMPSLPPAIAAVPVVPAAEDEEDENEHLEASGPDHLISDLIFGEVDFYDYDVQGKPSHFNAALATALRAIRDKGLGRSFTNRLVQQDLIIAQIIPTGTSHSGNVYYDGQPAEIIAALDRLYTYYRNGNSSHNPKIHKNPAKAGIFLALMATHPKLSQEQNAQAFKRLGEHYLARYRGAPGYKKEKKDFLIEHALTHLLQAFTLAPSGSALNNDEALANSLKITFELWSAKKPKREEQIRQQLIQLLSSALHQKKIDPASANPFANLLTFLRKEQFLTTLLQQEKKKQSRNPFMALLLQRAMSDPNDVSVLLALAEEYETGLHLNGAIDTALAIAFYRHILEIKIDAKKEPGQFKCQLRAKQQLYQLILSDNKTQADAYLIELALSGNAEFSDPALRLLSLEGITGKAAPLWREPGFRQPGSTTLVVNFTNPDHLKQLLRLANFYSSPGKQANPLYAKIILEMLHKQLSAIQTEPILENDNQNDTLASVERLLADLDFVTDTMVVTNHYRIATLSLAKFYILGGEGVEQRPDLAFNLLLELAREPTELSSEIKKEVFLLLMVLVQKYPHQVRDFVEDIGHPGAYIEIAHNEIAHLPVLMLSAELLQELAEIKYHGLDESNLIDVKANFESILHIPKLQQLLQKLHDAFSAINDEKLLRYFQIAQSFCTEGQLTQDELVTLINKIHQEEPSILSKKEIFFLKTAIVNLHRLGVAQVTLAQQLHAVDQSGNLLQQSTQLWFNQYCEPDKDTSDLEVYQELLVRRLACVHLGESVENFGLSPHALIVEIKLALKTYHDGIVKVEGETHKHNLLEILEKKILTFIQLYEGEIQKRIDNIRDRLIAVTDVDTQETYQQLNNALIEIRYFKETFRIARHAIKSMVAIHEKTLQASELPIADSGLRNRKRRNANVSSATTDPRVLENENRLLEESYLRTLTGFVDMLNAHTKGEYDALNNYLAEQQTIERKAVRERFIAHLVNYYTNNIANIVDNAERSRKHLLFLATLEPTLRAEFEANLIAHLLNYYNNNIANIADNAERSRKHLLFLATLEPVLRAKVEANVPVAADDDDESSEDSRSSSRSSSSSSSEHDLHARRLAPPPPGTVNADPSDFVADLGEASPLLGSRRASSASISASRVSAQPSLELRPGGRLLSRDTAASAMRDAHGSDRDIELGIVVETPDDKRSAANFSSDPFVRTLLADQSAFYQAELAKPATSQATTEALQKQQLDFATERLLQAYLDENPGATKVVVCIPAPITLKQCDGFYVELNREQAKKWIKNGEFTKRRLILDKHGTALKVTAQGTTATFIVAASSVIAYFTFIKDLIPNYIQDSVGLQNLADVAAQVAQIGDAGSAVITNAGKLNTVANNTETMITFLFENQRILTAGALLVFLLFITAYIAYPAARAVGSLFEKGVSQRAAKPTNDKDVVETRDGKRWIRMLDENGEIRTIDWVQVADELLYRNFRPENKPTHSHRIESPQVAVRNEQDTVDWMLAQFATADEYIRAIPNVPNREALRTKVHQLKHHVMEEFIDAPASAFLFFAPLDSDTSSSSTSSNSPALSRRGSDSTPVVAVPMMAATLAPPQTPSMPAHELLPPPQSAALHTTVQAPPTSTAIEEVLPIPSAAILHPADPAPVAATPKTPPAKAPKSVLRRAVLAVAPPLDDAKPGSAFGVELKTVKRKPDTPATPGASTNGLHGGGSDQRDLSGLNELERRFAEMGRLHQGANGNFAVHRGRLLIKDKSTAPAVDGFDASGMRKAPAPGKRFGMFSAPASSVKEPKKVGLFRELNDPNFPEDQIRTLMAVYNGPNGPEAIGRVTDDGGCFFASIADGLNQRNINGNETTEKSLRNICYQYATKMHREVGAHLNNPIYRYFYGEERRKYVDLMKMSRRLTEFNPSEDEVLEKVGNEINKRYTDYVLNIRFTTPEIKAGHGVRSNRPEKGVNPQDATGIWGVPELDGMILCQQLSINIEVNGFIPGDDRTLRLNQQWIVPTEPRAASAAAPASKRVEFATDNLPEKPERLHEERTLKIVNHGLHFVPILARAYRDLIDPEAANSSQCEPNIRPAASSARGTLMRDSSKQRFMGPGSPTGSPRTREPVHDAVVNSGAGVVAAPKPPGST